MATRLLSVLIGAFTDRFRTTGGTVRPPGMTWPPGLGPAPVDCLVISRRFASAPGQVRHARAFVAEIVGDGHPCLDDALLLTSELATNAVEHPTGPPRQPGRAREFLVTVAFVPHGLLITVQDPGSLTVPCPRDAGQDATGGRGLALVNALATRWGFHRDSLGTVIWFELGSPV
ncbi:anti-sigma regulatory factor (Ser/Thr protein kinase) [Streptosporangium album]|uniref:Anti-sigma regulatory factor (Ser/Thr protein kinase) n=1 Tax=Streptosporangium album TaxID=47479 RepID=A0A7W7W9A8_9ACTN|nr:ATP-binding protein [Streptosporangium album]MBB4937860.1 anti-sigma regulatory factor (Ser/Thr protein kinase) [Streptosporangium album]